MPGPKLFFHLWNREIEQSLLNSNVLDKFTLIKSNHPQNTLQQLVLSNPDLAMIELNSFNQQDYQQLIKCAHSGKLILMLLSNGVPNLLIDKAMLNGVSYHFRAPYHLDIIEETLRDVYQQFARPLVNNQQSKASELDQFGLLLGSSEPMRKLYRNIRKVAATEASVFISGESGSGKELVANTIHLTSSRSNGPFIAINCGALSPELVDSELFGHIKGAFTGAYRDHRGVFEQANEGTLFLDEITEMPREHQVKLLRILESGEYRRVGSGKVNISDVRILAATNRDPISAINNQFLREDLYFRLSQFPIHVPSLKERMTDIAGLAKHFLAYRNANNGQHKYLSNTVVESLVQYSWPGNVRELKHAIERAFILADDVILPEHIILQRLAASYEESQEVNIPLGMPIEQLIKLAIEKNLAENLGNKSITAQKLGISVKTLYNKLEKYQSSKAI